MFLSKHSSENIYLVRGTEWKKEVSEKIIVKKNLTITFKINLDGL